MRKHAQWPSVAVMPAPGKPFDVFVAEEPVCRQFAHQFIGNASANLEDNGLYAGPHSRFGKYK
jgi:hypothetical protein